MRSLLLVLPLLAVGCIREPVPTETPARVGVSAPGYAWPPEVAGASSQGASAGGPTSSPAKFTPATFSVPETALTSTPPSAPVPKVPRLQPPPGDACLARLQQLGVPFSRLDARKGVQTPVVVKGPIGSVRYVAGAGLPLELDCRMAVTLAETAPILNALGITALRFSGAYVYRRSRVGRLSLHAYGLAVDVHAAKADGKWHEVKTSFSRGLANGCANTAPILNQLACELKRTKRFKEMLTPDYNADHHDHFHWGIAPLPSESPGPAPNRGKRNLTRP